MTKKNHSIMLIILSCAVYFALLALTFFVFEIQEYYLAIFLPLTVILGVVIANLFFNIHKFNKEHGEMTKFDIALDDWLSDMQESDEVEKLDVKDTSGADTSKK